MKHLILARHAQTESAAVGQQDFDRSLTRRGIQDANEMAQRLQRAARVPDKILTSAARRAHSTASLFANAFQFDTANLITDPHIYSADQVELLAVIRSAPDCNRLLLVGHNPTISELANRLSKDTRVHGLPPCGIVSMDVEIDSWSELAWKVGVNVVIDLPDQ